MKRIFFTMLLLSSFLKAQDNSMLNANFWKSKPDVTAIKAEVSKGNNPAQANGGNHDIVSMAINNEAPLETIKYLIDQPGNSVDKLTHDGRLYIHWAASRGNVELINYLISKGTEIDRTDDKGATPLAFAASNGQINPAVYEAFFKAGINPKQKYTNGATILLLAIPNDTEFKLTDYLTTKGLSLKDTDELGKTAFDYAARNGNVEFLKKIIEKGIKPTGNALIIASQGTRSTTNGLSTYKYLVEDLKLKANSVGENGENVLHNLVKKKDQTENINYFIAKGVDVNATDKDGNNAFMNASGSKNLDAVQLTLPKVKNINAANSKGETALMMAVHNGSPEIVSYLIEKGAKTDLQSKDGNLGYYLVQSYKAPRPGEKNEEFKQKLDILTKNGFNFATPQPDGSSLYSVAVSKNDINLFNLLDGLKIDVNAANSEGTTALHKAALMAKDDVILKHLVSLGANKKAKTEFDETAYDLASENESLKENKISIDFLK